MAEVLPNVFSQMYSKFNRMPKSVDPDETARYEPSHLDLHFLQRYLYWSVRMKKFTYFSKSITPLERSLFIWCTESFHKERRQVLSDQSDYSWWCTHSYYFRILAGGWLIDFRKYANNEDLDQPANLHSLISTFDVRLHNLGTWLIAKILRLRHMHMVEGLFSQPHVHFFLTRHLFILVMGQMAVVVAAVVTGVVVVSSQSSPC